jgi:hypothetical protein
MAGTERGVCPFSHDYRQCYEQCALYASAIGKCTFFVSAMLLEDLQKIAIVSYEKFVREEEKVMTQAIEETKAE